MRIISGNFKGKKILQPKDNLTRPLKDLTKESIFNIINHSKKINLNFKNLIVLDLFSGVGSFGIECLSRGAKHVVFYENYNAFLTNLKKNLKSLKSLSNFKIVENDIYSQYAFLNLGTKFNIIFLDPPYADNHFVNDLILIKKNKAFQKNHVVIIHREKSANDNFDEILETILTKKYGRSKIIFGCFI